jgi:hypothetical protein
MYSSKPWVLLLVFFTVTFTPSTASRSRGPEKISIARLPVTGSELFGREENIAFLDNAWASEDANVVTIVAWAGVGSRPSSTIGLERWLPTSIVLPSWFLAGRSTGKALVGALRPRMSSLMPFSPGSETRIHGLESRGRRAKG